MIAIYVIGGLLVYVVGALITGWIINKLKPEDRAVYMAFWPILLPLAAVLGNVLFIIEGIMEPLAKKLFDEKGGE
jgi:hypothetical protein